VTLILSKSSSELGVSPPSGGSPLAGSGVGAIYYKNLLAISLDNKGSL